MKDDPGPRSEAQRRRLVALTVEKAGSDHIHEIGTGGEIVEERDGLFEIVFGQTCGGRCRALCTGREFVPARPLVRGVRPSALPARA